MPVEGDGAVQMIPLWVQWLFAIGGFGLLVVIFVALWSRLGKIEKRIGHLEVRRDEFPLEEELEGPAR